MAKERVERARYIVILPEGLPVWANDSVDIHDTYKGMLSGMSSVNYFGRDRRVALTEAGTAKKAVTNVIFRSLPRDNDKHLPRAISSRVFEGGFEVYQVSEPESEDGSPLTSFEREMGELGGLSSEISRRKGIDEHDARDPAQALLEALVW